MAIVDKIFGKKEIEVVMRKINVDNLSIFDLSEPLFPVVPTPFYLEEDSPLNPIYDMRGGAGIDLHNPSREYLVKIEELIKEYPHHNLPYYWLAEPYIVQSQYKKAAEIIKEGFLKVANRSLLAFTMGTINLRQSNPIAIGWYMQSCLLATNEFIPYILCAVVAQIIGDDRLYWRLLNAGDVIEIGKRVPADEEKIKILTRQANNEELSQALKRFESNMNGFLPKDTDIPKDSMSRDVFLWKEVNDYVVDTRLKLLRMEKRVK